ncbi:hypothetical protein V5O48_017071 [Marasmius crinis-equi]|uniref:MYND-type domain-containing protein n=1 Tax=Marasmius crinis-equi TaxID=585013 RepID=A0ABR3EPZ9_9AGAR
MNSKEITKNIQPAPPAIDLDNPDIKTSKAFGALAKVADDLSRESTKAAWILEKNRERAWPWIVSWARAALDSRPTTRTGEQAIDQLLYVAPHLLLRYIKGEDFEPTPPNDNFSAKCFASRPTIVALALELWLLGDALNHPDVLFLVQVAGGFISSCFRCTMKNSPARDHCYAVLRSPRWDIPATLLKGIIREATLKDMHPRALSPYLLLMCTLLDFNSQIPTAFIEDCIRKSAPRWATFVLRKLASPPYIGKPGAASCVVGALSIVESCSKFDCFSIIEALDLDFLSSLFRHRDLVANDDSLAQSYSRVLDVLMEQMHHRALAVRVIRSMKKIARMNLNASTYLKNYGRATESWTMLCKVANGRWTPGKTGLGWYEVTICGHEECAHRRTLKLNHKFKRCSGCLAEIYCSAECQKGAWKVHRRECDAKRERARAGQSQYEPSPLDLAFVYKCVYEDFHTPDIFRKLIHAPITNLKEHPVLLIDYREDARKIEPVPLSQAEILIKETKSDLSSTDLEEAFSGFAIIPWRMQKLIVVLIRTDSDRTVTSQAEKTRVNWRRLAPRMLTMLRLTDPLLKKP